MFMICPFHYFNLSAKQNINLHFNAHEGNVLSAVLAFVMAP